MARSRRLGAMLRWREWPPWFRMPPSSSCRCRTSVCMQQQLHYPRSEVVVTPHRGPGLRAAGRTTKRPGSFQWSALRELLVPMALEGRGSQRHSLPIGFLGMMLSMAMAPTTYRMWRARSRQRHSSLIGSLGTRVLSVARAATICWTWRARNRQHRSLPIDPLGMRMLSMARADTICRMWRARRCPDGRSRQRHSLPIGLLGTTRVSMTRGATICRTWRARHGRQRRKRGQHRSVRSTPGPSSVTSPRTWPRRAPRGGLGSAVGSMVAPSGGKRRRQGQ
mmetsp:Transcript_119731/g.267244  ORF Transcript_119731/g.267244 Transcript_119731/m.267244 type:complete len:279 (+) Transcript_119731:496-1332(+)